MWFNFLFVVCKGLFLQLMSFMKYVPSLKANLKGIGLNGAKLIKM